MDIFLKFYGLGEGRRAFSKVQTALKMKFAATVTPPPTVLSENFSRKFRPQKIDLAIWQTPS